MKILIILALVAAYSALPVEENPSEAIDWDHYCYSNDTEKSQKLSFATKTAYQYVKGKEYIELSKISNCKPTKFWLFSRHGTRLPEIGDIKALGNLETRRDEILKNFADGKIKSAEGGLCNEDVEMLRNWVLNKNITEKYEQYLVDQGWDDLKLLAKDYQAVYPELLLKEYDSKHFLFRHTDIQRTEASYKAFVEGLFGEAAYENITLDAIPEKDILLDPHDNCDLFTKQYDEAKEEGNEIDKFQNSELMNKMLAEVSTRLGYDKTLEYKDVALMFDMCAFEQAWFIDKPSAWCTAFHYDDVKIFEFFEDMKHQYKAGYAGDLDPKVPCEIIQDMVKRINSDDQPLVTGYFSHSTLMHLTLVALGAFKDKDLVLSNNYDSMKNRNWRTSVMVPFAANVAVVKYSCTSGTDQNSESSTKVRFLHNQKPLELDWCKDGLCELKDVVTHLEYYAKADCPNEYCRVENSGSLLQASILVTLVTIVYSVVNLF